MEYKKDQRTPEEQFDDLLADGRTLDVIASALGWSHWHVVRHYRQVCTEMGELPDEM